MTAIRNNTPKSIVLDASVVLKWYLQETDSKRAARWYRGIKQGKAVGIVPDYLYIEVTNVLLNRHHALPIDIFRIISHLNRLGLTVVASKDLKIERIVELAHQLKLSTYDALYLELARITGTKVLTSDRSMLRQAKSLTRSI